MYKKKEVELFKFKGCKNCQRNCLYNSLVATRDVAERERGKFPCNLSIAKVWLDKTFKEVKNDKER